MKDISSMMEQLRRRYIFHLFFNLSRNYRHHIQRIGSRSRSKMTRISSSAAAATFVGRVHKSSTSSELQGVEVVAGGGQIGQGSREDV